MGEMGTNISRTFNDATNIEVPFSYPFHNSHNTPHLWENQLNILINPQPLKLPQLKDYPTPTTKQDHTYVAPTTNYQLI
jgi:hypothetical protein